LLEADVLLSDGSIVTCSETKHRDLFYALANSYGTLGYILRVKIKLRAVLPYMLLTTRRFETIDALLKAMKAAAADPKIDSIESLVYTKKEMYLTTAMQSETPQNLMSIYGKMIFYKAISKVGVLSLTTKDFLFRYDPEWFWNVPQTFIFTVFRILSPHSMRNSAFYTKYGKNLSSLLTHQPVNNQREQLIQDWEVPWKHANTLLSFFLSHIDLCGLPILVAPVKVPQVATLYPMKKNELYFNLGSYSFVKKIKAAPSYETTKIIDTFCFSHEGIKMLYSSSFLTETEFSRIYNGAAYKKLKQQYDPKNLLPSLFEKTVQAK
jgi:FAD/FMN-containing dehydrogenase